MKIIPIIFHSFYIFVDCHPPPHLNLSAHLHNHILYIYIYIHHDHPVLLFLLLLVVGFIHIFIFIFIKHCAHRWRPGPDFLLPLSVREAVLPAIGRRAGRSWLWFMVLIFLGFCLRCSCDFKVFCIFTVFDYVLGTTFIVYNVHCVYDVHCLRCSCVCWLSLFLDSSFTPCGIFLFLLKIVLSMWHLQWLCLRGMAFSFSRERLSAGFFQ